MPAAAWAACVELDGATLVGWDALPAGKVSLDWGTTWAMDGRSLLARVPSVIVPEEFNVLINPAHADIVRLNARKVRKWVYDARFAGSPDTGAVPPRSSRQAGLRASRVANCSCAPLCIVPRSSLYSSSSHPA